MNSGSVSTFGSTEVALFQMVKGEGKPSPLSVYTLGTRQQLVASMSRKFSENSPQGPVSRDRPRAPELGTIVSD